MWCEESQASQQGEEGKKPNQNQNKSLEIKREKS